MTMHVQAIKEEIGTVANQVLITTAKEWKAFQELIQRGANLWPDAPPEIKEFADKVTVGHVQQDYYQQNKDQQKRAVKSNPNFEAPYFTGEHSS